MNEDQTRHDLNLLIENDLYDRIVCIEGREDISKEEKEKSINELYEYYFNKYKDYYKIVDIDELIAKIEKIKTEKYKIEHPKEFDMDR